MHKYIECSECNATDFTIDTIQMEGRMVLIQGHCNNCKKKQYLKYKLVSQESIQKLKGGDII